MNSHVNEYENGTMYNQSSQEYWEIKGEIANHFDNVGKYILKCCDKMILYFKYKSFYNTNAQ